MTSSLRQYCARAVRQAEASPYELAKDLIGRVGSGRGDLSTAGRKYLIDLLHARRGRRPR